MRNVEQKEAILDCAAQFPGNTPTWVANRLNSRKPSANVSKSAAYYHMTAAGYWPLKARVIGGRGNPFTPVEDAHLVRLRTANVDFNEIGRTLGRAPSSVRLRLLYLASLAECP